MPALIVAAVPSERTGSATSLDEVLRTRAVPRGEADDAEAALPMTAAGPRVFDDERRVRVGA
jgi:hypothetical protein